MAKKPSYVRLPDVKTRRELKWQTQRPSGTPSAFRQFSSVQKQAAMMLPLFLSE
jgi:hypothetical protein